MLREDTLTTLTTLTTRMMSTRLRALARSPLAWILSGAAFLRLVGIGWGLPASDGWDNDGVAPRDFLVGLIETFKPGHYFTYPPAHLALLALATSPITALTVIRAPSLAERDVIAAMLQVPTMTAIAVVARLVSLAMSLGVVWSVAKTTEEMGGRAAGAWAAAFVGVNAPLTYYAHTTNLDVPYLFWGGLALLAVVRAVARGEPRRLRRGALYAALAVTSKDQAYALFLLSVPAAFALWAVVLARDADRRPALRALGREAALAAAIAALVVVALDGALYNPAGFVARVRFLLGPASQSYAQYTDDWLGRRDVVVDVGAGLGRFYPWVLCAFAFIGLARAGSQARRGGSRAVVSLLPLLVAVSFLVAFNCVARRTDERFALPEATMLAVYGGLGLDTVASFRRPAARLLGRALAVACLALGLYGAAAVDANLVGDPRYAAEAWLREHVGTDDTVETYGLNVYMPRFPESCRHVVRVGPASSDHRNPMPGVREVFDAYDNARARGPKYIVVSEGWAWRYLIHAEDFPTHGHMLPSTQRATAEDPRATKYFRALWANVYAPYRLVYAASFQSKVWPRVDLHASTGRPIWIYERVGG